MKHLLLIFLFTNVLLTSFAQELPEVPLKNGLAYYKFDHNVENLSSKCISKFVLSEIFLEKTAKYAQQYSLDKSGFLANKLLMLTLVGNKGTLNCTDTLKITSLDPAAITLIYEQDEISWTPPIAELLKKKIIKYHISASCDIIFKSKSEYQVIVKNVNCTVYWMQGGKMGTDIFDIGELYSKVLTSNKITKMDVRFFGVINQTINASDEIILKSLVETIKLDQL